MKKYFLGIIFHDKNTIFSVGMDQQVIMYHYNYNNDILSVTILKRMFTFVTDIKGITSWYNSKYVYYLIFDILN